MRNKVETLNSCVYDSVCKESIPFVTKSPTDITITGESLKSKIGKYLYHPQKTGFYVRVIICYDHTSNVREH